MRELGLALAHWEANCKGRALVPVFLDVSWEECKTMRQRYDKPGFWDGWEKPEPTLLEEWATDLKRLSGFAGVRSGQVHCMWGFETHQKQPCDHVAVAMSASCCIWLTSRRPCRMTCAPVFTQTDHFNEALATRVVDAATEQLKKLGRVPRTYSRTPQLGPPMALRRLAQPLIGEDRWAIVDKVKASLETHGAAVVWGGPGEGKSCVGLEAACQLWEADKCLGGALDLNLAGEAHSWAWKILVAHPRMQSHMHAYAILWNVFPPCCPRQILVSLCRAR